MADQVSDRVHLIDPHGKVLQTVQTDSHNTSGVAVGGGFIWLAANGPAREGHALKLDKGLEREIVQADMNGKTVKHHEVPLGGGGITGVEFAEGKVWITSTRLAGLMQVDPATFLPEFMFALHMARPHGLAWDNGFMWIVDGSDDQPSIMKANPKTGRIVEIVELSKNDPDPHGLAMYDGHLYYCDAGIHPGWPELTPQRGWICRVDIENS